MAQYISRPTTVEAFHYQGSAADDFMAWLFEVDSAREFIHVLHDQADRLQVKTIQGVWVVCGPGEWIIKENEGPGFYPCHADTFIRRYMRSGGALAIEYRTPPSELPTTINIDYGQQGF